MSVKSISTEQGALEKYTNKQVIIEEVNTL